MGQFRFGMENRHSLLLQFLHNLFIVNDRTVGIYFLTGLYLLIYGIHCSFDTETESCALSKSYFHSISLHKIFIHTAGIPAVHHRFVSIAPSGSLSCRTPFGSLEQSFSATVLANHLFDGSKNLFHRHVGGIHQNSVLCLPER